MYRTLLLPSELDVESLCLSLLRIMGRRRED